ncbi:1-deoxy-D-xylulose-5-phosphate synthase [Spirochaetia bacterium]|nr:1-deoxy-D-xylulose-5-phosphate synthase [Spirochaetia bacterium]
MYTLLDKINSPNDLKKLNPDQLPQLAEEIRHKLLEVTSRHGGHIASNLGFVETSIALHYVFNSPEDQFVFDVSHQSYVHKLLTGRRDLFENIGSSGGISGFTSPSESEYDIFDIGHTATSISLASGLAKGRDLYERKYNVIAIIGDGSLSGGEAFEGLNFVATYNTNFIIIVNDNENSIDPNVGGLYSNLTKLRKSNGTNENNYFRALGFDYKYVEKGNNVLEMIAALKSAKDINHPIVIHIHTKKGKGYKYAEENPSAFHWAKPFDLTTGKGIPHKNVSVDNAVSYLTATLQFFDEELKNKNSVIVEPGAGIMSRYISPKFPKQYIDTGITEEHAVAFCSGIARNGGKPYLTIQSSFVQRAFDQIHQDLCLNNTPATLIVMSAGVNCFHDAHIGLFDIAMLSNIPNLVYMAPSDESECIKMLEFARDANFPTAIRQANFPSYAIRRKYEDISDIVVGKSEIIQQGEKIVLLGLGDYLYLAHQVADLFQELRGIKPTIVNPRFASHIDEELLLKLKGDNQIFVTFENGIIEGGFGQKIAGFLGKYGTKVLNFGAKKEFTDRIPLEEQKERYHLNPEQIIEDISKQLIDGKR